MPVLFIVWFFVALGIGFYARKNKFGFWRYFLISFFFTPVIGGIVFAVDDAQRQAQKRERLQAETIRLLKMQAAKKAEPPSQKEDSNIPPASI